MSVSKAMCLYAFLSFILFFYLMEFPIYLYFEFLFNMWITRILFHYTFYVILQNLCVTMHLKYLNCFSVVKRNNPPLFHKGIKLSFYFYLFTQLFILLSPYPFGPTFLGIHCPKNIQICLNPSPSGFSTRENSH